MTVFNCIKCGRENDSKPGICECAGCHASFAIPVLENAHVAEMYSSANLHFRAGEFDKAAGILELILKECPRDPVAQWMLLLCTYGILYCQGKNSSEWRPTMKRYQPKRIIDDEHFQAALSLCDEEQRNIFTHEAEELERIRAHIEAIQKNEEPVDVFISYKETDDGTNEKTHDSTYAQMLYNRLKREGYKVFYAPFTLLNKSGELFEPYIYAALHSAKTMVVIGTKPEYFNAPWIRNEWSRYIPLAKDSNGKRRLISVYRDMNPKELPEELNAFQLIPMDKVED